jgi:signal transduction histidine kinase
VSEAAAARGGRRAPRRTLAARVLVASAVLALLVAVAFAVLLFALSTLRDATRQETRARELTAAALVLERIVLDLETGLRGLVITGDERFLAPWSRARDELPAALQRFERLAADEPPAQTRLSRQLAGAIRSYVREYSLPLVEIARENRAAAGTSIAVAEGRQRVERIRRQFRRFLAAEDALAARSARDAADESDRAVLLGAAGLVASALLIVGFGAYLVRFVARPVHEVAAGAARIADGELSLRLPEGGPGEIAELRSSFNAMAARLELGRRALETQNAQLRESERLKSELVSIVSHEVRTPLASVIGFTSLLLNREADEETSRRYLEIVDAQARRLASLLDDFLDLQRVEEGRLEIVERLLDMGRVVRDQVQLFTGQSRAHRLELLLPDDSLPVVGDENRLAQVVGNLLSNAIKYSPEGGSVRIVAERGDGSVRVSIHDEGLGIPEEQHSQVFTKFFRGDAAAGGIPGSGLGLAFSRAVVEAHGGRLDFTSAPGEGSTFWVELPAAEGSSS